MHLPVEGEDARQASSKDSLSPKGPDFPYRQPSNSPWEVHNFPFTVFLLELEMLRGYFCLCTWDLFLEVLGAIWGAGDGFYVGHVQDLLYYYFSL